MASSSSRVPREQWFQPYLLVAAAAAASPLVVDVWSLGLLGILAAFLFMALALLSGPFVMGRALARGRPKRALFTLLGMALIVSTPWTLPVTHRFLDDLAFRFRRRAFDELVSLARQRQVPGGALRMVVDYEDKSLFVTSNLFKLTIYDEADEAERDPLSIAGYWPCPGSSTGVLDVGPLSGGSRSVEHVQGHYYRMVDAN